MIFSNISTISKTKGVDLYVQAINQIDNNDLEFHIVGKFDEFEKDFEYEIKDFIDKNNIANIHLKGFISDINNYIESVDVIVLTTIIQEALGGVLAEGLAKGKILIGTRVGGVAEVIDESVGNLLIEPNSIEAIKNAIDKVSKYDQNKINNIKEHNINKAKEQFNLDKQVQKVENIYSMLLERK